MARLNFQRVEIEQVSQQFLLFAQGRMPGPHGHDASIGQNNLQLAEVLPGRAINRGVRAARIVGDHPAEGRPGGAKR